MGSMIYWFYTQEKYLSVIMPFFVWLSFSDQPVFELLFQVCTGFECIDSMEKKGFWVSVFHFFISLFF